MIAAVIFAVVAIGLASAAMYTVLQVNEAQQATVYGARNFQNIELAAAMLRANLRSVRFDGNPYPPAGALDPTYNYTTLPPWLGAPRSSIGVPFLYCPVGIASAGAFTLGGDESADTVTLADGSTTYDVATVTDGRTNGQAYVTQADGSSIPALWVAGAPDVVAFLVAPTSTSTDVLSCDTIDWAADRGHWVPHVADTGGIVRAILRDEAVSQRFTSGVATPVLFAAPTATGDGSGRDDTNRMTLAGAMSLWAALRPPLMRISLGDGSYTDVDLDLAHLDDSTDAGFDDIHDGNATGSKLVLEGQGAATTRFTGGMTAVAVPADLHLEDVGFTAAMPIRVMPGRRLYAKDVDIGRLEVDGGEARLAGTIDLDAGSVTGAISVLNGGRVHLVTPESGVNSTVTIDNPAGDIIQVGSDGEMTLRDTDIEIRITGFALSLAQVSGRLTAIDSTITAPLSGPVVHGLHMLNGSHVRLTNVTIGSVTSLPNFAVVDDGALSISGTGSTVYGTTCWFTTLGANLSPTLFAASEIGPQPVSSQPVAPVPGGSGLTPPALPLVDRLDVDNGFLGGDPEVDGDDSANPYDNVHAPAYRTALQTYVEDSIAAGIAGEAAYHAVRFTNRSDWTCLNL